jgi:hypothetical protein
MSTLYQDALDKPAVPAMSAECERVFSSAKKMVTAERRRRRRRRSISIETDSR